MVEEEQSDDEETKARRREKSDYEAFKQGLREEKETADKRMKAEEEFEDEMKKRLAKSGYTDAQIETMVTEQREKERMERRSAIEHREKELRKKAEKGFEDEFRKRSASFGNTDTQIANRVTEERQREERKAATQRRAPVYPKIHTKYLAIETLRYYEVPWEYDRVSDARLCYRTC